MAARRVRRKKSARKTTRKKARASRPQKKRAGGRKRAPKAKAKAPARRKKAGARGKRPNKPAARSRTTTKRTLAAKPARKAKRPARATTARRNVVATKSASVTPLRPPSPTTAAPTVAKPAAAATGAAPSVAALGAERVGVVEHYFGHAGAAALALESGAIAVGDLLHFRGFTTDYYQRVDRMERDHAPVERASAGDRVGVQVAQRVREGDEVFRLTT